MIIICQRLFLAMCVAAQGVQGVIPSVVYFRVTCARGNRALARACSPAASDRRCSMRCAARPVEPVRKPAGGCCSSTAIEPAKKGCSARAAHDSAAEPAERKARRVGFCHAAPASIPADRAAGGDRLADDEFANRDQRAASRESTGVRGARMRPCCCCADPADSPVGPVAPPQTERVRAFVLQWIDAALEISAAAASVTIVADGERPSDALPCHNDRLAVLSHWLK